MKMVSCEFLMRLMSFALRTIKIILPFFALSSAILKDVSATQGIIWSKRDKAFVPLFSISTFLDRKNEFLKSSLELEHHNFQKEVLKVGHYEENRLLNFIDNDTKLSGACGELWTTLADYLNFTLVPVRSKGKTFGKKMGNTYTGILALLFGNRTDIIPRAGLRISQLSYLDFTLPFWIIRYYLYIQPTWKHNETWMLHLFDAKVWTIIFLLLFVFVIAGYICDKSLIKSSQDVGNSNLQDHMFYTLAIASTIGSIPHEIYAKSKIVYCSLSTFGWVILIAFNSHALIRMMNRKSNFPFTDIKSLIEKSNYYIFASKGSSIHDELDTEIWSHIKYVKDSGRVLYLSSTAEVYNKICSNWNRKYAAFEAEDNYKAIAKSSCHLIPIHHPYFTTWVGSAVKRDFKYKRSIDIGILKMLEAGLIDGLKERWLDWKYEEIQKIPFQSISLRQVYLLFFILFLGLTTSIIVLLAEYLTYSRNNTANKNIPFNEYLKFNCSLRSLKVIKNQILMTEKSETI